MSKKNLLVKAGNIANLTDARYFAARDVKFLGFCLDEANETFVNPIVVKAMKEWIEGPQLVGEFGMQSQEEIQNLIKEIGLTAVQLSPFTIAYGEELRKEVVVIREIIVEKTTTASEFWEMAEKFGSTSDYLLLDFEKNNIAWNDLIRHPEISIELLQRTCQKYKVFLSLIFKPQQIDAILNILQPTGIAMNGSEEEKVGLKSFDEIDEIFDALEE
jgi:phosphoribosylanthranilate isomerase